MAGMNDQNEWLEEPDMMDNSTIVSKWKENFGLSQPTPSLLFEGTLFFVVEATNRLLTIPPCWNVPGVIVAFKRLGIRISFQCKPLPIRII